MSRFFASGSSSESEETSVNEEFVEVREKRGLFEALSLSGEENGEVYEVSEEEGSVVSERPTVPVRKSRFMFDTESESEEEESTQRQIKSHKEKIQEELENLSEAVEAGVEAKDWISVQEDFDRLIRLISKHQKSQSMPASVYRVLPVLESVVNKFSSSAGSKSLNAISAKAFNALRQKVRKAVNQYVDEIERAQNSVVNEDEKESIGESISVADTTKPLTTSEALKTTEITPETLLKRLQEIIGSRGRKHVDKAENINVLRKMIGISTNRRHVIHALVALIATEFEVASNHLGYIPVEAWNTLLSDLSTLIDLLQIDTGSEESIEVRKEEEELGLPSLTGLRGSMISYIQRLDDEFTKALQNIDPHSNEYIDYLRSEPRLYSLLDRCRSLILTTLSSTNNHELACQLAARQLEHVYYKSRDMVISAFKSSVSVLSICGFIYQNGSERQTFRALLCHVYWLAIHNEYVKARDLMMQFHIQDVLYSIDIPTQILYNRALVQVGLAAFRAGHLKEAYFALQELCSTGRPKELLAQGLVGQKYTEKAEMDRAEKQRLIPFHMQINVEMIDCVFLTVAMLLELPQNAAASRRYFTGERRLFQSRHLRRILDAHDRTLFNGPPENTREFIVAAAKALANGCWRMCEQHMMQIKIWDVFPDSITIRKMLRQKIREAALFSFLYSVGPIYSNLSIEHLVRDFDLPSAMIINVIGSLIADYGLPASMSNEQDFITFRSDCEPSPTRELILQLIDKIGVLEERNTESSELLTTVQQLQSRNLKSQETLAHQMATASGQS